MPAEGPPLGYAHTDPHFSEHGVCVCSNSCCLDPYAKGNPCVCVHCTCHAMRIPAHVEKS